jgi:hypothetical protein
VSDEEKESLVDIQVGFRGMKTLMDNGLVFSFDADETCGMAGAQLIECRRFGALLRLRIDIVEIGGKPESNEKVNVRRRASNYAKDQ